MSEQAMSAQQRALVTALLDFERMPGRYPLARREPRTLFDGAHTVLLLAAGRPVDGLAGLGTDEEADARRAARFFVRTAFLRQDSDHYTLLGLRPDAAAEQVREHYRLMIRLTHPDFEASGEHWPADAASRINIANDVLASPVRRREYDEHLDAAAAPMTPHAPHTSHVPHAPRPVEVPRGRRGHGVSTRAKVVVASLGALLSAGALWLLNPPDSGSLSARQRSVADDTASYVEQVTGLGRAAEARPAAPVPAPPAPLPQTPVDRQKLAMAPPPKAVTSAEPVKAAAPAPAPAPALAPTPAVVAVAEPVRTEAVRQEGVRLSMEQVQPALTNVVGSLYHGRGENLAQWIGSDWRSMPANHAFVTQFNDWMGGLKVTQLGKVSFKSRSQGDQLVVDGVVELHLQDTTNGVQVRELQLRAYFQPQDGRPVLTQLVASQAR